MTFQDSPVYSSNFQTFANPGIAERLKVNLDFRSLCGSIEELGKAFPKMDMAAILVM